MPITDPQALVDRYLRAIGERDFASARTCLGDRGFRYSSPIGHYDDADSFIANIEHVGPILVNVETRFVCADGKRVCHFLDVTVSLSDYTTQTAVQLATVENGRIVRLEVVFDASEYHRMFGF